MDFDAIHQLEIGLMMQLQAIRGPFLDQLMIIMDTFDTLPFYYFFIACVWFGYDQKCGKKLLFLFVISAFINSNCKELFSEPRPCMLQPELGILTAKSFGFPSGGAQANLALLGFLALTVRKMWFWVASTLLLLLICFARVYLGLHFPTDILGGWVIGIAVLSAYWMSVPSIERFLSQKSSRAQLLISVVTTGVLCFLSVVAKNNLMLMLGLGAAVGLIYAPEFLSPKEIWKRLVAIAIAFCGFYLLRIVAHACTSVITEHSILRFSVNAFFAFCFGLWISLAVPCLMNATRKIKANHT